MVDNVTGNYMDKAAFAVFTIKLQESVGKVPFRLIQLGQLNDVYLEAAIQNLVTNTY